MNNITNEWNKGNNKEIKSSSNAGTPETSTLLSKSLALSVYTLMENGYEMLLLKNALEGK